MLAAITWGTYIFFAAFCLLALGFTYFCIPETRGKVRIRLRIRCTSNIAVVSIADFLGIDSRGYGSDLRRHCCSRRKRAHRSHRGSAAWDSPRQRGRAETRHCAPGERAQFVLKSYQRIMTAHSKSCLAPINSFCTMFRQILSKKIFKATGKISPSYRGHGSWGEKNLSHNIHHRNNFFKTISESSCCISLFFFE